jgi:hypothetical protein
MRLRMHRTVPMLLAVLACSTLSLVAVEAAATSGAGAAMPTLVASPTSLEFGSVTLGDFTVQSFTLTNPGPTSITFQGVVGQGGDAYDFSSSPESDCTSVDPNTGAVTMASGNVCTIDVSFAPGALGPRGTALVLEFSGGFFAPSPVDVSGTGTIGYYQVSNTGKVAHFGDAAFYGDASTIPLAHPIVDIATTGDNGGYWLVATDGGVFNYGDANFYGSTGAIRLNKPIVGMAPTIDNQGYWLVASDGGIFSYGDALFYGSTGDMQLNKPIVGMAATPDGGGYWLVASDGGIFAYGDAQFYGSTGAIALNKPIVGMVPTPDGGGYWLVASDGGIFAYGDALFFGSNGAIHLNQPIVSMAAMPTGNGYWFTAADGGLFNYGDAPFQGSATGQIGTVVAMATDGAPTLQAFLDLPALRHHTAGGLTALQSGPPRGRFYAGP